MAFGGPLWNARKRKTENNEPDSIQLNKPLVQLWLIRTAEALAKSGAPGPGDTSDEDVVGSPWWETGSRPDDAAEGEREAGTSAPAAAPTQRTEYMYRGVRYGAPATAPKSPAPEQPDRDDDPVDLSALGVQPEDQRPLPPAEGREGGEPAIESPWWDVGSRPEEAAAREPEEADGDDKQVELSVPGVVSEDQPPVSGEGQPAVKLEERPPAPSAEGEEVQEQGAGSDSSEVGSRPEEAAGGESEAGAESEAGGEPEAAEEPSEDQPAMMSEDQPAVPSAEEAEAMEPITAPPWWRTTSWDEAGSEEEPDVGVAVGEEAGLPSYGYGGAGYGQPIPGPLSQASEEPADHDEPEDTSAPAAMPEQVPAAEAEGPDHTGEDLAADRGEPERATPASFPALPGATGALPEGPPGELIRSIVAEVCPGELLLVEMPQASLPEWTSAAVTAARNDLDRHVAERKPIDAGEYLRLAIVEHVMGLYEEADGHLKEALPRSDQFGPVLNALAVTSLARGKIAPAIVYCKEALRETGGDDFVHAAASSNLGDLYRLQGDVAQATEAYETAIQCLGPEAEPRWRSRLHLRLGHLYRSAGHTDQARLHLADSVRLFKDSDDETGHVQALVALGSTLTEAGLHDAALRSFEEAVRICLRTGDKPGAALVQDELGVAYMVQDQLTRALAYFESALSLHRELGNRDVEAATLNNMAKIHESRGDMDQARRFYDLAREIAAEEGNEAGQAASQAQPEHGDEEFARARLLKAEEIFSRAGSAEQDEARVTTEKPGPGT